MLLQIAQRLLALLSIVVLVVGAYLLWSGWAAREAVAAGRMVDDEDWRLWVGGALVAWSLLGRWPMVWLLARKGDDQDRLKREPGSFLRSSTTARIHVERHGPPDAPAIIFVHGWGMAASVWWEARRQLADRYQVITFDLAGLGRSHGPTDGLFSLDQFSDDLACLVETIAPRKAVLVGHSIGGMILQTFALRHGELLRERVLGLVLENTTHTDPSQTTILGRFLGAMKPVLAPMMKLDVPLTPVIWLMNWQSYLSGATHAAMRLGFGTRPTWAQLEQVARLATRNPPSVQAKGNVAMMHWDATRELGRIQIPVLVFIGGRDLVTIPSAGEVIAQGIPSARASRVAEAGHMGPLELADRYNAEIAKFADEVFTSGAAWADRPGARAGGEPLGDAAERPRRDGGRVSPSGSA